MPEARVSSFNLPFPNPLYPINYQISLGPLIFNPSTSLQSTDCFNSKSYYFGPHVAETVSYLHMPMKTLFTSDYALGVEETVVSKADVIPYFSDRDDAE